MSEGRALANLIGNGLATIVINRCKGELTKHALHNTTAHPVQFGEHTERVAA